MKVCVLGLWHLGSVTAACLAGGGHEVTGADPDGAVVGTLAGGRAQLFEPGLDALLKDGIAAGKLAFTTDLPAAVGGAEIVWVTLDTPVDDDDIADTEMVMDAVRGAFGALRPGALVIVSSQLPVGSVRTLADEYRRGGHAAGARFACSPENLRLGKAIEVFTRPDRVIVGLESNDDRERVRALLAPFTPDVIFMGLELAEMTKHAINAFLATSVVFANEIAELCEKVGADAKEVERGLKSEARIGPKAYLSPGAAFAGGTLARDVNYLAAMAEAAGLPVELVGALGRSNRWHATWARRRIDEAVGPVGGRKIALLGLAYKADTSTLRRSGTVELGIGLAEDGAEVAAFDPRITELPAELQEAMRLAASPEEAMEGASAIIVGSEWPALRDLDWAKATARMAAPVVIDANWFLAAKLRDDGRTAYHAVGLPPPGREERA